MSGLAISRAPIDALLCTDFWLSEKRNSGVRCPFQITCKIHQYQLATNSLLCPLEILITDNR